MLSAIKYNLSHLTDFSGRDGRQTFWFYVLFLVVVQYAIGLALSVPMMVSVMSKSFEAASSGVDEAAFAADMMAGMTGYIETQMWISAVIGIVMIGLMAAAFVRRLHDAGFTGLIALIPIATQLFAMTYSFIVMEDILAALEKGMAEAGPDMGMNSLAIQAEIAPLSIIGWIGYLVVIGFGVLKSQDGPNGYGGAPVSH